MAIQPHERPMVLYVVITIVENSSLGKKLRRGVRDEWDLLLRLYIVF